MRIKKNWNIAHLHCRNVLLNNALCAFLFIICPTCSLTRTTIKERVISFHHVISMSKSYLNPFCDSLFCFARVCRHLDAILKKWIRFDRAFIVLSNGANFISVGCTQKKLFKLKEPGYFFWAPRGYILWTTRRIFFLVIFGGYIFWATLSPIYVK